MRVDHVPILTAGNLALASLNSIGINIDQMAIVSIQAVWTGTAPTGSFELQASNDIVPIAPATGNPVGANPGANVVNWSTLTCSVAPITASGNFIWNVPNAGYRWIRLHWTGTSGTGSVTATLSGKG